MFSIRDLGEYLWDSRATLNERMRVMLEAALLALLSIAVVFYFLYAKTGGRVSVAGSADCAKGGGPGRRSPNVRVGDLLRYRLVNGSLSRLNNDCLLEFGGFVSGTDELAPDARVTIDLPIEFLCNVLPFQCLVMLAKAHRIVVSRAQRSVDGLKHVLSTHVCDMYCSQVFTWFVLPAHRSMYANKPASGAVVSARWLSWYRCVHGDTSVLQDSSTIEFKGIVLASLPAEKLTNDRVKYEHVLAFSIPLRDLMIELPKTAFMSTLRSHGIMLKDDAVMKDVVTAVSTHVCDGSFCAESLSVFSVRLSNDLLRTGALDGEFPPNPLSVRELRGIVHDWCEATSAREVYEQPCNVCGLLTRLSTLHTAHYTTLNLTPLCRPGGGVTRRERMSVNDPVVEIEGPILYGGPDVDGRISVCEECLSSLRRGRVPKMSLANGLWVGDVPAELRRLNFVEKLLVSVERHNVCIAKVTKGQYKMTANAVVYAQPVGKMFNVLPPSRDELAEFLAIIFVGPCRPMPVDLKRTPFIVRRRVVLNAFRWLILNHCDYAGVVVSHDNLEQYDDDEPPVCVVYRAGDGEIPSETQPGYGGRDNEGLVDGECSFSV